MGILKIFQKNNEADKSQLNAAGASISAAKSTSNMQGTQPGSRIGAVIERMYRLVVSADLDRNSCYIECGQPQFGETLLPKKGTYDAFEKALKACLTKEDQKAFEESFGREALIDTFSQGKGFVSELMTIEGLPIEIRAERIPEKDENSKRVRCCLFLRYATSLTDDGQSDRKRQLSQTSNLTDEDKLISAMFTGCYEINRDKNLIVGYQMEKGRFVRSVERTEFKMTVESYIRNGTIHKDSANAYRRIYEAGYLNRVTSAGSYAMEVCLRRPGTTGYRWYEDVIFPVGKIFRVYRRDIDNIKKSQGSELQAVESEKYFNYNRSMLRTVASLVEFRNAESGDHLTHVNEITRILLEDIAERSPQYGLTKPLIRLYTEASTMHDIGKVTISDSILNKPGKLTPEEREEMKKHTTNGALIIDRMEGDSKEPLYDLCRDIALHHHERWDGKGYPEGLEGDAISIGAQAVSIADAFDALSSRRAYKEPVSCDESYRMIAEGKCGAFNPRLLESLKKCLPTIRKFYEVDDTDEDSNSMDFTDMDTSTAENGEK